MNKKQKISIFFFLALSPIGAISCKKNNTGGKAEIHALIFHGANPVIGTTTLYVKFNSRSQPAGPATNYDLKVAGEADDNHVHVEDLEPGDYYLYAVAFDSLDMKIVKGGAPVKIHWKERKELKEVRIDTN